MEWISVKDRLPENSQNVLAYSQLEEEERIVPCNYYEGFWLDCIFDAEAPNITHWMPLPEPPKSE